MDERIKRLRQAIEQSGLTYAELGKKTGIAKSSLQRYATGETKKIPIDSIEAIAKATNVSPRYLMGWEDGNMERIPQKNIVFNETPSETPIELNQESVQETLEKLKDVFSNINDIIYDTAVSDERYIRYYYSMLNQSGKKEALKRVIELTRIDDYIKNE